MFNGWMVVSDEEWKHVVCFKVLFYHSPGGLRKTWKPSG